MTQLDRHAPSLSATPPRRRLILVCQTFYPDSQSHSQLYTVLLEKLVREQCMEATVLCSYPTGFRERPGKTPRSERWRGIDIRRCGTRMDAKRGLMARTVGYVTYMLHALGSLIWLAPGSNDVVVGVTCPPFMAMLLWMASGLGRFHFRYVFQDVYPEGLMAIGAMRPWSPIGRLWRFFNRRAYHAAQRLAVVGRDMTTLLHVSYGLDPARITFLPHWSPVPFEPTDLDVRHNPVAIELGIQDKFIVQYAGNMGLWHDMDILVRAAQALQDNPQIHFLFMGRGRRRFAAQTLCQNLGLRNVTWRDFVPKEQLAQSLACCHISLISLRAGLSGVAVPSKLYGILASGRPIIAQVPADSEVALAIAEDQSGLVVPPGDLGQLVAAIGRLYADRNLLQCMSRRATEAYRGKYALECAAAKFVEFCAP